MNVDLLYDQDLGNVALRLFDAGGEVVAEADTMEDDEELRLEVLAAGTYTLQVDGEEGAENLYLLQALLAGCSGGSGQVVISEVFYDPDSGGDEGREWVELYNDSDLTVDLSGYALGAGGSDYTNITVQLEGTLRPGQCFVIGGPSDDDNGSPVYDQVFNFSAAAQGGLQNGGSRSDGVALFDVPASMVLDDTVPVDALIYEGSNSSGLLGPEGGAGEVGIGSVPSGNSAELTPEGWIVQPMPSPGDCSPVSTL